MIVDSENFIIFIDEPDKDTTYVGKAPRGSNPANAVWQIKKVENISNTEARILWAEGDDGFKMVWNDRTLYTYK